MTTLDLRNLGSNYSRTLQKLGLSVTRFSKSYMKVLTANELLLTEDIKIIFIKNKTNKKIGHMEMTTN